MEINEDFWLQYDGGSGFQTVATYTRGVNMNNNTFYHSTITLASGAYNLVNGGQFRFRCDASDNSDLIYIDAVTITGTSGTSLLAGSGDGLFLEAVGTLDETQGFAEAGAEFDADLWLYPSPATDLLHIATVDEIVSVSVYTIDGKVVMEATAEQFKNGLNVSKLSAGSYLIKVVTTEEVLHNKFLKQ
jgi:hypothetical protein